MKAETDARRGDIPEVLGAAAGVELDGGEVDTPVHCQLMVSEGGEVKLLQNL